MSGEMIGGIAAGIIALVLLIAAVRWFANWAGRVPVRDEEPAPPSPPQPPLRELFEQLVVEGTKLGRTATSTVETFQTPEGPVTVSWSDPTMLIRAFGPEAAKAAKNKERHQELCRRIGDLLKSNPHADLTKFQDAMQIEITAQDGPHGKGAKEKPDVLFDSDQKLAAMKAIAEIDRFHETHKAEFCGPDKPQKLCADFQAMINRHKSRILEKM